MQVTGSELGASDEPGDGGHCLRRTFAVPFDDAVNLYHTDPEMFLPATVTGSPASRVAPTVVPLAGSEVTGNAAENRSLTAENVTAMLTLPFAPFTPSTCRLYNVPCVTVKATQLAPGELPPVVQLSLLATGMRALTAVPV